MDAATVRAWAAAAARALDRARAPIDLLNVFPVPDGDTGTNLALTVAEGAEHVDDAGPAADAAAVATAFARGALLGARGNSGVIVSQYLHGFAAGLAGAGGDAALASSDGAAGLVVAAALDEAQRAARAAVARPVEGTILTAATAASLAAGTVARAGGSAEATTAAAVRGAREALQGSTQALDVLRAAGVVDAGASGLLVMLEALAAVVRGVDLRTGQIAAVLADAVTPDRPHPAPGEQAPGGTGAGVAGSGTAGPGSPADGEFEVMFVLEPHPSEPVPEGRRRDLAPEVSARMQALGGSVAVVGGTDGWHVHVHTDRPADAVSAGGELGTRSQVVVRQLATTDGGGAPGVVVATAAPGLVADLARSGALVLVLTGWPVRPRDLLRAVVDTGAARVVVVPGSPAVRAVAQTAAALADVPVEVLDADDDARVVVAVSAGAGLGPGTADAMRAALAAVRTAVVEPPDVAAVADAASRLLADGGELVTVVAGAALCPPGSADAVDAVRRALVDALRHRDVEVVVLAGSQEVPAAVVAVE